MPLCRICFLDTITTKTSLQLLENEDRQHKSKVKDRFPVELEAIPFVDFAFHALAVNLLSFKAKTSRVNHVSH